MSSFAGFAEELKQRFGASHWFAAFCWKRGLQDAEALLPFLQPKLSDLPSPFVLQDMERAVDRVVEAVANEEPVAIYGDYDVDGTCGAALLHLFFKALHIETRVYQPDRFSEGYGLHSVALGRLADEGARVVIAVDCGITAVEPAQYCQSRGVDLLVLDHHIPGPLLPQAYAVVDPLRSDDTSGLVQLCGAGLAFFFVVGLRNRLRDIEFFESMGVAEPSLVPFLDLVATATIADLADVRGVNRVLITHGLKVLNRNPRPGFKALLDAAGVQKVGATQIGFVLGPRINAAGRLASAQAALRLLTSQDPQEAKLLAEELEVLNAQRRETQDQVFEEAMVQARAQMQDPCWAAWAESSPGAALGPWPRALVLKGEHWHEGVVGIVASKVVEQCGRPVFVLAQKEDAQGNALPIWKGSVRSLPKIDIFRTLQTPSVAETLINFGGHAHAGGVTVSFQRWEDFLREVNFALAKSTDDQTYQREYRWDLEFQSGEMDATSWARLAQELEALEPFGMKFPEPVFRILGSSISGHRILKERHQRWQVSAGLDAVWFSSVSEERKALISGQKADVWVRPEWNEWNGTKKLQLRVTHAEAPDPGLQDSLRSSGHGGALDAVPLAGHGDREAQSHGAIH